MVRSLEGEKCHQNRSTQRFHRTHVSSPHPPVQRMARLHLSEECHQSGQLRKCHHSRQVGFHLARTHVILTLPRPPPFFNTTPEKCHRNGHSLTVHLLRYSDTKDLKMPLSTKYRRQLAPSFMGANYMSKSHVTVVGAVAEGKTCQRSSPNLR